MWSTILYVAANGCKWRALPSHYGPWHSIYTRMSRWAKAGVLDAVFERLQRLRLMQGYLSPMQYEQRWYEAQRKKAA